MTTSEHIAVMGNDFVSNLWHASCSCGWESRHQRDDQDAATDDWELHCDAVFIDATTSEEPQP